MMFYFFFWSELLADCVLRIIIPLKCLFLVQTRLLDRWPHVFKHFGKEKTYKETI